MKRTKPIERTPDPNLTENFDDIDPTDYIYGREYSDVNNTRNGRTFKVTFKYQIGKKADDKKGGYRSGGSGGGGMMDMGY